jgi:glutathione S-transferase
MPGPLAQPKIVVYGPISSPFIEKVAMALALKGLAFESVEPAGPEDFRRWNPETGLLPVMDIDGERVADSSGILDWLDERFPEPPLSARDSWTARSQRMLEVWTGETFYYYWVRWLRAEIEAGRRRPAEPSAAGGDLARLGILGHVGELLSGRDQRGPGLGPEFARRLDDLVGFLGERPYYYAERVGRADLTVAAFLRSLASGIIPGGRALLLARPTLLALMDRVAADTGR